MFANLVPKRTEFPDRKRTHLVCTFSLGKLFVGIGTLYSTRTVLGSSSLADNIFLGSKRNTFHDACRNQYLLLYASVPYYSYPRLTSKRMPKQYEVRLVLGKVREGFGSAAALIAVGIVLSCGHRRAIVMLRRNSVQHILEFVRAPPAQRVPARCAR